MRARRDVVFFRNDLTGQELLFSRPVETVVAWDAGDLRPALDRIETLRRSGRWIAGYLSYEAGYLLDPALVPHLPTGRRAPLICFGVFDGPADPTAVDATEHETGAALTEPRATWGPEDYRPRFERLHRHLREGDCYQSNLTLPITARWQGDPLAIFAALRQRQPVRHSAFVDLDGPVLLSRSPELFFDISRDGWIETLPMKGTARRGATAEEDRALKEGLAVDPKNQAENRMIVDLLRNDVSHISEVGTLDVPDLFRVETYATVHQMVSRIRAKLLPGLTFANILHALYPCGSITGAPKISAMKIIRALEESPRDAYCGAIGWLSPDGRMRFNVAIRTISLFPHGEAVFNVGGGVVFDSTAEGEYAECLLKARFATGENPGFYLIETMRWEPGNGVVRHDRHLDRLGRAAAALGFAFDDAAIRDRLASIAAPGPLRLRLTLQRDGQTELEAAPFIALAEDSVWRLRIASVRLASRDPLLRHKTSRREFYEAARAQFTRDDADEVLLLNEQGHVCEGTITTLFARMADGALVTPPLECGLLAGVLRGEMIAGGQASEGFLHPEDLLAASELYVGNSLRGMIRAQLIPGDGD